MRKKRQSSHAEEIQIIYIDKSDDLGHGDGFLDVTPKA